MLLKACCYGVSALPDTLAIAGLFACLRLLACILLLVSPMAAAGPQVLRVDGSQSVIDLQPYISYLRDPAGSLQIEQVRQQAEQFRPASERRDLNFGYTHDHLWLSLDLVSTADELSDWLIEMSYSSLDRVSLYSIGADGIQVQHSGDTLAYGERSIGHRNPLFALRLANSAGCSFAPTPRAV